MPYVSQRQAGYFHTRVNEIGAKTVKEFDKASKGKKLPKRAKAKKKVS